MSIEFLPPLADASSFPEPFIKGTPHKILKNLSPFKNNNHLLHSVRFTQNARNGLALIGQNINLGKGDVVLLPGYHCPALVEPFIWLDVNIRFYQLNKDLSINQSDFVKQIDESVRACVIVQYFGFSINNKEIYKIARQQGIIIINDLAHDFFALFDSSGQNPTGQYAVASCYKFFPSIDGGLVSGLTNSRNMQTPGWKSELKSLINQAPGLDKTISTIRKIIPSKPLTPPKINKTDMPFRYFKPQTINHSCYRFSQFIIRRACFKNILQQRRLNYSYLAEHLSNSPTGIPLYPLLEDNNVPYVFPFVLHDHRYFSAIRKAGIGLYRWEELSKTHCKNSAFYRKNLIQIPCHQDLAIKDLKNIVNIINNLPLMK